MWVLLAGAADSSAGRLQVRRGSCRAPGGQSGLKTQQASQAGAQRPALLVGLWGIILEGACSCSISSVASLMWGPAAAVLQWRQC